MLALLRVYSSIRYLRIISFKKKSVVRGGGISIDEEGLEEVPMGIIHEFAVALATATFAHGLVHVAEDLDE